MRFSLCSVGLILRFTSASLSNTDFRLTPLLQGLFPVVLATTSGTDANVGLYNDRSICLAYEHESRQS